MIRKPLRLLLAFIAVFLVNFAHATPRATYGAWGIDLAGMDTTRLPGDDFYGYVNGKWMESNQIPPDKSSYGSFHILDELSKERVREIVEFWAENNALTLTSDEGKVAHLYRSFMDETTIEELKAIPLLPYLDQIMAITSKDELAGFMGKSFASFGQSLFSLGISIDAKNPSAHAAYLSQGRLGLPDRDYYLSERFSEQKQEYINYIAKMLAMIGFNDEEINALAIVDLETKIAAAHWSKAESRERNKTYNPTTINELTTSTNGFSWTTFFEAANLSSLELVIVRQSTAIPRLAEIFNTASLDQLKIWQLFSVINQMAPYLSHTFMDAHWQFNDHYLNGTKEQPARWKHGVAICESVLGEVIGKEFVARYFDPHTKEKMDQIVTNLLKAMEGRIKAVEWMGETTKAHALKKLSLMNTKIGYPSVWQDYSPLQILENDLIGSLLNAKAFERTRSINKLNQPVDKNEWGMTPQTVNAYYDPSLNEIVFPAAILQPPFFDAYADAAVNYGSIGAVIGHEITHAFDDQGKNSDGYGKIENWWTDADSKAFEQRATILGQQYEAFTFIEVPDSRINPKLTMGENIADLGGILLALDAYRLSKESTSTTILDGFSNEQRLFLGLAQIWRTLQHPESLKKQLANNPHSPGKIRSFASLRNIDAWYEAFTIQPESALYIAPQDRVRLW